jgi:hypothetical protein
VGGDHGTVTLGVRDGVRRTAGEGAWDRVAVGGGKARQLVIGWLQSREEY